MSDKADKKLTGLFRDNVNTPEGKYLVKHRDGTVPPWPSFVLGGDDPIAEVALRAYAAECRRLLCDHLEQAEKMGLSWAYAQAVFKWSKKFEEYRNSQGESDPGMSRHRVDDPATIEEMRKGMSA